MGALEKQQVSSQFKLKAPTLFFELLLPYAAVGGLTDAKEPLDLL